MQGVVRPQRHRGDQGIRRPRQSARTVQREAFQSMLEFIRAKKESVGYVVVHDLSRFARNMEDQIEVISNLHTEGVLLRSVMEDVDETAAGKMVTNMHGLINQFFSDRNAERTRLGMEKAAKEGKFPFKAPLGYVNVRAVRGGANLLPDPERAPLISKAFELYSVGNLSRAELLRKLTNLGLTSASGKRLTAQSLENILRNPAYAGRVVIANWGIDEQGGFDPLVSLATFQRVQDIMDGKNRAVVPHVRNNEDFPLRVFVRCAHCREPLTGSWSKGRSRHYAYYRCRNRDCLTVKVRKDTLERDFLALLHRLTPTQDFLELFRDIVLTVWENKQTQTKEEMASLQRGLKALAARKNTLVDRYLDGRIDEGTYQEQTARMREEIVDTETRLHQVSADDEDIEALLTFSNRILADPATLWTDSTIENRQRLQQVLFPDGLVYSKQDGFGTTPTSSAFNALADFHTSESNLASPMGFEPMLSP